MPPSLGLPPVVYCLGTKPIQAASSRPDRKCGPPSPAATTGVAMIGPMPGKAASRRQAAFERQIETIRVSSFLSRPLLDRPGQDDVSGLVERGAHAAIPDLRDAAGHVGLARLVLLGGQSEMCPHGLGRPEA